MFVSEKFSTWDLYKKLNNLNWKGKYIATNEVVTFLSEQNETIAVVTYDNKRSLILSAKFSK